jgi:hypothetical protein
MWLIVCRAYTFYSDEGYRRKHQQQQFFGFHPSHFKNPSLMTVSYSAQQRGAQHSNTQLTCDRNGARHERSAGRQVQRQVVLSI